MRALVVEPDGTGRIVDTPGTAESIRELIGGGWLEGVSGSLGGDWHAYVDEEGKIKGLDPNYPATQIANSVGWPSGDFLVGSVVFLGHEGPEEADCPELIIEVARVIGVEFQ